MAYAENRSLNAELLKGTREGGNYDETPNRGGVVSAPTAPLIRAASYRMHGC
ncbi:hypothetical protein AB0G15_05585 [Streptosporangium sp. NPDC023825]|uniref:hypothetical protein n=1 Tax=Streptosporangium sp. NPDC023825 TaxID=3154909 RepID=UPI00343733B8